MIINNKRGISAVIITLILVLLAIVIATVAWVVVNNIVQTESERVNIGTRCLAISIDTIGVTNTSMTAEYNVILKRSSGGDPIDGVKLVITNATLGISHVERYVGDIDPLDTITVLVNTTNGGTDIGVVNANKIEVIPYFVSDAGSDQDCTVSTEYQFTL